MMTHFNTENQVKDVRTQNLFVAFLPLFLVGCEFDTTDKHNCLADDDCLKGRHCVIAAGEEKGVCRDRPDNAADDSETGDTDGDVDTDVDSDSDADTDSDTDTDTDTDSDTDTDTDSDADSDSDTDACGGVCDDTERCIDEACLAACEKITECSEDEVCHSFEISDAVFASACTTESFCDSVEDPCPLGNRGSYCTDTIYPERPGTCLDGRCSYVFDCPLDNLSKSWDCVDTTPDEISEDDLVDQLGYCSTGESGQPCGDDLDCSLGLTCNEAEHRCWDDYTASKGVTDAAI